MIVDQRGEKNIAHSMGSSSKRTKSDTQSSVGKNNGNKEENNAEQAQKSLERKNKGQLIW